MWSRPTPAKRLPFRGSVRQPVVNLREPQFEAAQYRRAPGSLWQLFLYVGRPSLPVLCSAAFPGHEECRGRGVGHGSVSLSPAERGHGPRSCSRAALGLGGSDVRGVLQELKRQLRVFSKSGFPCSEYSWKELSITCVCVCVNHSPLLTSYSWVYHSSKHLNVTKIL